MLKSVVMLLLHQLWDRKRIHQQWRATLSCLHWQSRTTYQRPQLWRMVSCSRKRKPSWWSLPWFNSKELIQSNRWFKGPSFVWQEDPLQLQQQPSCAPHPSDIELRKDPASTLATKVYKTKTSHTASGILEPDRFKHVSMLNRLKRCIVQVQRVIERLRPNKEYNWRPREAPPPHPIVKELSQV